jgi:hypothetical protein
MSGRYESRVKHGAKFLDKLSPGWYQKIALDSLAMESCDKCILGHLYGDYFAGWRLLLKPLPSSMRYRAADFGFTLYGPEQDTGREDYNKVLAKFHELAESWRDEIRSRLENT